MKAEPLEFPKGVRFARADEVPAAYKDNYARIANARITTGFVRVKSSKSGFSDMFEVNVHASRVWAVFRDLVDGIVPKGAAPIVGLKDEEPILGPYTTREAALGVLEPFKDQLQHDGFLEFGIMFQRGGHTEEVFVKSVKYVQVWTNKPEVVLDVLSRHGIAEVIGLQFIDNYPRVTEALPLAGRSSGQYVVIEVLKERFQTLPSRPDVAGA